MPIFETLRVPLLGGLLHLGEVQPQYGEAVNKSMACGISRASDLYTDVAVPHLGCSRVSKDPRKFFHAGHAHVAPRDVIMTSVVPASHVTFAVCGVRVCVRAWWADVNQTQEPGDDVGGLKGSNVNHNNLPNSEPGAGAADAAATVGGPVAVRVTWPARLQRQR